MPTVRYPGVYVGEVPGGARSIEGVPTSTTIFVGETERGPLEATPISGRRDYERLFGGYRRHLAGPADPDGNRLLMPYALDGFLQNGGTMAYILRAGDGLGDATVHATAYRDGPGGTSGRFLEASSPGAWGQQPPSRHGALHGRCGRPPPPRRLLHQAGHHRPEGGGGVRPASDRAARRELPRRGPAPPQRLPPLARRGRAPPSPPRATTLPRAPLSRGRLSC